MVNKKQCTSDLRGNSLSLSGTNIKQVWDIISDSLLLIPKKTPFGFVSLGVYIQAEVIYNRHKDEIFKLSSVRISGHSLGAGVGCLVALMLSNDNYSGEIYVNGSGGVKCLSRKAKSILGSICFMKWSVRHRDPIPFLGFWKEPINFTHKTGTKRKHILDWDMKEHMMYWS